MELPLPPLLVRVNVLVVMVEESMSSLNVALIALLTPTPVALLAGLVELTVGDVVSVSYGADGGVKLLVQRATPFDILTSSSQPLSNLLIPLSTPIVSGVETFCSVSLID